MFNTNAISPPFISLPNLEIIIFKYYLSNYIGNNIFSLNSRSNTKRKKESSFLQENLKYEVNVKVAVAFLVNCHSATLFTVIKTTSCCLWQIVSKHNRVIRIQLLFGRLSILQKFCHSLMGK